MSETVGPQMDESQFDEMWADFEADNALEEATVESTAPATTAAPSADIPDAASHALEREEREAAELRAELGLAV